MKIIIFTAVFGSYQKKMEGKNVVWSLPQVLSPPENWDLEYYLFTDKETMELLNENKNWNIILYHHSLSSRMAARKIKIIDYKTLLPPHDLSIWMDSNVSMTPDTCFRMFRTLPLSSPMWTLKHPSRKCTYDEIEFCYQKGMGNLKSFRDQRSILLKEKFPKEYGLAETRILGRLCTKEVFLFNETWWTWFTLLPNHHLRDQCSFMPAVWTCKFERLSLLAEADIKTVFQIERLVKSRTEYLTGIRKRIDPVPLHLKSVL